MPPDGPGAEVEPLRHVLVGEPLGHQPEDLGLASGPVNVALPSVRQRKTDPARFGRVLAISVSLNVAGFPLGSAAVGPLLGASITPGVVFAAAACALAGLLTYVTVR